jgi:F420-non-reducing hydrogenase iron-sulfur subunit
MIMSALKSGADGILVSGCHPGDCHYINGNLFARRRFPLLSNLLDFVGIEPGRINFSWVSASEGEQFADIVKTVTEKVKALGPATRLVKKIDGRQAA